MKRYLLFAFDWYYPSGGTNDLIGDFSSPEEAAERIPAFRHHDEFQLLDTEEGGTVAWDKAKRAWES